MPSTGVACVYCFYNPATGKSYIGLTEDFQRRLYGHYSRYLSGDRSNKLYCSMRKHGWDAFEYRILARRPEGASANWLQTAERIAIKMYDSYHNGYNMTEGGETSSMKNPEVVAKVRAKLLGRKQPAHVRAALLKAVTGRRWSDEERRRASERRKGRKQTPEHAAKKGLAVRGEKNGNWGRCGPLNPMFGRKRPDASEMNRRRAGPNHPRFGMKDTPETTAKRIAGQITRRERERAERLAKLGTPDPGPSNT